MSHLQHDSVWHRFSMAYALEAGSGCDSNYLSMFYAQHDSDSLRLNMTQDKHDSWHAAVPSHLCKHDRAGPGGQDGHGVADAKEHKQDVEKLHVGLASHLNGHSPHALSPATHHKALFRMDDVEETEEQIEGHQKEGLVDHHSELHETSTVEVVPLLIQDPV